jgi:hypothetical protein
VVNTKRTQRSVQGVNARCGRREQHDVEEGEKEWED